MLSARRYNPWDVQTHRANVSDAQALARLRRALHTDGFFGDIMVEVPYEFYAADPGTAIAPEGMGEPDMQSWHTLGWGYWQLTPIIPGRPQHRSGKRAFTAPQVDFFKWAVDARWMTNACERYSQNHTDYLQTAFFNGVGFVSWETVWGQWNQMVPRDAELLRRTL